jgi:streptogramin lyase
MAAGLVWVLASACAAPAPASAPGTADARVTPPPSTPATIQPTTSPAPGGPSAASPTPEPLAAMTEVELTVAGGPDFPIAAFGSLWLLTPDASEPSITRLDPETNDIIATIPVGGRFCQALGATDEAIWACGANGVLRVDPASNEVVAEIELKVARVFSYLPSADGAVWALAGEQTLANELVRIDPADNSVARSYPLDFDAEGMSYGEGALWLTDTSGGSLWRFDPVTEELTQHTTGLAEPGSSAVGGGSVWLAVNAGEEGRQTGVDSTLVRIDPTTGDVEREFDTGGTLYEGMLYASDEAVWVRASQPFLTRIDPVTNEITQTLNANMAGGSVTVAYGSVWVTSFDFDRVWRLMP